MKRNIIAVLVSFIAGSFQNRSATTARFLLNHVTEFQRILQTI